MPHADLDSQVILTVKDEEDDGISFDQILEDGDSEVRDETFQFRAAFKDEEEDGISFDQILEDGDSEVGDETFQFRAAQAPVLRERQHEPPVHFQAAPWHRDTSTTGGIRHGLAPYSKYRAKRSRSPPFYMVWRQGP